MGKKKTKYEIKGSINYVQINNTGGALLCTCTKNTAFELILKVSRFVTSRLSSIEMPVYFFSQFFKAYKECFPL